MEERQAEPEESAPGGASTLPQRLPGVPRGELGPLLANSLLPFVLVLYLALSGGGYDRVVFSEVGVVVWWLVLVGAAAGVLSTARISRAGWPAIALLAAFAAWTALSMTWSESAERSAAEAGRVLSYLGVLVLALAVQRGDGLRRMVYAVAAAIAIAGVLALLSRLHPSWFPPNEGARVLPPEVANRLGYPLNYWNGLAALIAMGVPLLLHIAGGARNLLTRAAAAGALPALVLAGFYTFSRGGVLEVGVALLVFFALYPRRLVVLPTLLVSGAAGALLIALATRRDALENHVLTDAAHQQGNEMLGIALALCAAAALAQIAIARAQDRGIALPRPQLDGRRRAVLIAGVLAVVVAIAIPTGVPGEIADRWEAFQQPIGGAVGAERYESATSEARNQYWGSALDANTSAPVEGIGAGTFEFWWARNGVSSFVRDAHSLFLESLAELGIIGFVLAVGLVGSVISIGLRRVLRSRADRRANLAAALASCLAFAAAAAVDWAWELAVLPVAFLLLAAAILATPPTDVEPGPPSENQRRARVGPRVAIAALAFVCAALIAIPLAGTLLIQRSEDQLRSGQLGGALDSARTAETVQPYAATPHYQQALALRASGRLAAAAVQASEATEQEPTNWRTWLLLSEIQRRQGRDAASADTYERAFLLNPRSPYFQGSAEQ